MRSDHGIVNGAGLHCDFSVPGWRRRRNTAALGDTLFVLRLPIDLPVSEADHAALPVPYDQLGIDVLGQGGKFGLLAEPHWGRPRLDTGAAPVRAEQADGDATLLLQLTAKVVADRTKIGDGLWTAWLPRGGAVGDPAGYWR